MITYLKNMEGWKHKDLKSKGFDSIKELFDKAFKRVNMFVDYKTDLVEGSSKRAGDELEQEVTKKQKVDDVQETTEVDDDQEAAKIKELMKVVPDEEEVAIDAIPLATKPPTIDATYAHSHAGRKEISPYTCYNYRYAEQEASGVNAASEEVSTAESVEVGPTVPLVDILAGMPNYGKFLKELISNKHKIKQILAAFLSEESSAILQNKVPPKLGDPGSFLILCNFNKTFSCNALADLGASINLMPYSLYAKLSLETLKPTKMSVRLADRSLQYPIGIAENMLVEVGKFTFPADFVILEMKEDSKVPLILG
ncbi:reverse transcriptase domain-containing protein [Tanacetum coccineum]